jgi:molybdenum cofactor cytidylyltransferase
MNPVRLTPQPFFADEVSMITGIVLAGGSSIRFGQNKMVLPIGGQTMIERAVSSLAPFVVSTIVVTGQYHDEIAKVFEGKEGIRVVYNPFHRQGMFTSVLCGANAAPEGDLLFLPGDIPLVRPATVKRVLEGTKSVRVPVYEKRRGHPLYLSKAAADELRLEPSTSNLRDFRDRFEVEEIPVEDPFIHQDIDTVMDYERIGSGKDAK